MFEEQGEAFAELKQYTEEKCLEIRGLVNKLGSKGSVKHVEPWSERQNSKNITSVQVIETAIIVTRQSIKALVTSSIKFHATSISYSQPKESASSLLREGAEI